MSKWIKAPLVALLLATSALATTTESSSNDERLEQPFITPNGIVQRYRAGPSSDIWDAPVYELASLPLPRGRHIIDVDAGVTLEAIVDGWSSGPFGLKFELLAGDVVVGEGVVAQGVNHQRGRTVFVRWIRKVAYFHPEAGPVRLSLRVTSAGDLSARRGRDRGGDRVVLHPGSVLISNAGNTGR